MCSHHERHPRPRVIKNALLIRTTVLHDLSVLAIRRTVQINSQLTEIVIYFESKVAIGVGDEFD